MASLEPMFTIVFDELPDGVCATDPVGNILYMNPAAERLLEVKAADARDHSLCELLCGHLAAAGSDECASRCPLRDPACAQKAVTYAGPFDRKPGYRWEGFGLKRVARWKDIRVRCLRLPTPWLDMDRPEKHFTLIEDVSAEAELERHKEDWRNMVAHDLRTPLTAVLAGLLELRDTKDPADGASASGLIDLAVRNGRRLTELLDLYLDVAKLDAGLMPVALTVVDLSEAVRLCVEEQASLAQERRIRVILEVPEGSRVTADTDLLSRVIHNVLNNAIKFTPEGGRVELSGVRDMDSVILRVRDTGPGLSPEDLPHIFDRYYQARARRAGKLRGTGLGLTFCREALMAMKGEISIASEPGAGAEVVIRLPAFEGG